MTEFCRKRKMVLSQSQHNNFYTTRKFRVKKKKVMSEIHRNKCPITRRFSTMIDEGVTKFRQMYFQTIRIFSLITNKAMTKPWCDKWQTMARLCLRKENALSVDRQNIKSLTVKYAC